MSQRRAWRKRGQLAKARFPAAEQIELQDVPQRRHPIPRPDLLPLVVSPAVVADRRLVNRALQLRDLRRHLNFEAERLGSNHHLSNDLAAERFISRLDIRKVYVRKQV